MACPEHEWFEMGIQSNPACQDQQYPFSTQIIRHRCSTGLCQLTCYSFKASNNTSYPQPTTQGHKSFSLFPWHRAFGTVVWWQLVIKRKSEEMVTLTGDLRLKQCLSNKPTLTVCFLYTFNADSGCTWWVMGLRFFSISQVWDVSTVWHSHCTDRIWLLVQTVIKTVKRSEL